MNAGQAQALRAPFSAAQIGKLPRLTCRNCSESRSKVCDQHQKRKCPECGAWVSTAHIHIDFVGHAATTARLLEVDPDWTWEPMAVGPNGEPLLTNGGLWIRLTVAGVTRPGFGDDSNGKGMKEIIGDALRNAAMRFGVALDLWSKQDLSSGGAPEVAASPENSSVGQPIPAGAAASTEEAQGKPPLAPASAASPEPTYPGLGFPRHAEGWMLLEDEWDNICESLNNDSPGEAQRLVDRWAELDHDAEAAIKTVRASDDTRVLHLFADREARAHGRVTVLRAIQKRLERLTMPLPESLQPASALTRLQALVGYVKENPQAVPNPEAYTEWGLLQAIRARELGLYILLDEASDETLEHFWLQVPENLRLVIEGLPAQEVTRLADGA